MVYNRRELVWDMQWRGPRLMKTGFLVCQRCADIPAQQLKPRILPPDPVPIFNPRPEAFSFENGLQAFTSYFIPPPPYPILALPYAVYEKSYVLAQVASFSGIPTPAGLGDASGITGRAQQSTTMLPLDLTRSYVIIFNPTSLPLAISFSGASFSATLSIIVYTGQALFWSPAMNTGALSTAAISVTGQEPHQPYYAWSVGFPASLINDGGVLQLVSPVGWPTSSIGLPPGALWNNGLAIAVVPGSVPDPAAPPIYFGSITASELLALGGSQLPVTPQTDGSGRLWSNGGEVSVS